VQTKTPKLLSLVGVGQLIKKTLEWQQILSIPSSDENIIKYSYAKIERFLFAVAFFYPILKIYIGKNFGGGEPMVPIITYIPWTLSSTVLQGFAKFLQHRTANCGVLATSNFKRVRILVTMVTSNGP